jgi:hypothetical protein
LVVDRSPRRRRPPLNARRCCCCCCCCAEDVLDDDVVADEPRTTRRTRGELPRFGSPCRAVVCVVVSIFNDAFLLTTPFVVGGGGGPRLRSIRLCMRTSARSRATDDDDNNASLSLISVCLL